MLGCRHHLLLQTYSHDIQLEMIFPTILLKIHCIKRDFKILNEYFMSHTKFAQ